MTKTFESRIHSDSSLQSVWENCACLNNSMFLNAEQLATTNFSVDSLDNSLDLVSGFCTNECGVSMWVFLALLFMSVVASFASGIPSQQVSVNAINDDVSLKVYVDYVTRNSIQTTRTWNRSELGVSSSIGYT